MYFDIRCCFQIFAFIMLFLFLHSSFLPFSFFSFFIFFFPQSFLILLSLISSPPTLPPPKCTSSPSILSPSGFLFLSVIITIIQHSLFPSFSTSVSLSISACLPISAPPRTGTPPPLTRVTSEWHILGTGTCPLSHPHSIDLKQYSPSFM